MEFGIKRIESDDVTICINHGEVDELYEIIMPMGKKSHTVLNLCDGCVQSLYTITSLATQLGMCEFSSNQVKIFVPERPNKY